MLKTLRPRTLRKDSYRVIKIAQTDKESVLIVSRDASPMWNLSGSTEETRRG